MEERGRRHISSEDLTAYLDGEGTRAETLRIQAHLARCDPCRAEVAELTKILREQDVRRRLATAVPALAAAAVVAGVLLGPWRLGDGERIESGRAAGVDEVRATLAVASPLLIAGWQLGSVERRPGEEAVPPADRPTEIGFGHYAPVFLGVNLGRARSSRARAVSDDLGDGRVLVVGVIGVEGGSDARATVWEVGTDGRVGSTDLPLAEGFFASQGFAVSGTGQYVVGWATTTWEGGTRGVPVRWHREPEWTMTTYTPFFDFPSGGIAMSVNDAGDAVGWSTSDRGFRMATRWYSDSGETRPLVSPLGESTFSRATPQRSGQSRARSLNNQGYSVGSGWEPEATSGREPKEHAVLWLPDGTPCDLDPEGISSSANAVTELRDGRLFVAGRKDARATVWEVDAESCIVAGSWVAGGVGSYAIGIRESDGAWEISGGYESAISALFALSSASAVDVAETPIAPESLTRSMNREGLVAGGFPIEGLERAVLWVPNRLAMLWAPEQER